VARYFQNVLQQLDAPSDVRHALEQMHHLLMQETLTERDVHTVLGLVRGMQRSLGALPV
jgi:hypothetical protein